jgi:hypothetical protein
LDVSIAGTQKQRKKKIIYISLMPQIIISNVIIAQNAAESMGRNRQMSSWNQPQQQNNMIMGQTQFSPYNSWSYPSA